ncbi:hypothetical protein N8H74_25100 [Pseudomonas sp. B2M1-30]|uniref:Uncharacterized protein n=1 Tax=Pseudomonas koreensis TaxID=198620 RepID=A0A9X2XLX0_9PSED|nr:MULTISPECIES: hypothetical protein [Pseudomonas]MBV4475339.1 hypothetical protein [Pseudomonas botevensis]MCU0121553.1 hypothetical protein [Pseudomonas sp. B2M1-30]MCU7250943.1 hypothetical protein [Pseudomonas koreensis]MCU7261281.1 hypothetical protein [Pseudomonas koreensis]
MSDWIFRLWLNCRLSAIFVISHENSVDIERLTILFNQPVIENSLLQVRWFSNIRPAFTTTVYAFLNPKLPSAAWDFFCLRFAFL